jgi:hypothetical protein
MNEKHNMIDDEKEYRYEQLDTSYMLKCWLNGKESVERGPLGTRPAWLTNVLHVARVAKYIKNVRSPPPVFILWFRTDINNNLIEFTELDEK